MAVKIWYWTPVLSKEVEAAPGGGKQYLSAVWPSNSSLADIRNPEKATSVQWARMAGAGIDGTINAVLQRGKEATSFPEIGDDVTAMPDELGQATAVYTRTLDAMNAAPAAQGKTRSATAEGAADSMLIMAGLGVLAVFLLAGGSRR